MHVSRPVPVGFFKPMSYFLDVEDVAVIGIPNERYGEVPKAFVVKKNQDLSDEVLEKALVKFVHDQVIEYKRLRGGVKFIKEVPKSLSGKILRKDLKGMI